MAADIRDGVDVTSGATVSVSEPRAVFRGDHISVDLTLGYAVVGNGVEPNDGLTWTRTRLAHEHHESSRDQEQAADSRAVQTERRDFFKCHERRQGRDDEQVHHAAREQQQHQCPAAANAVHAVLESHTERTRRPIAPTADQESQRRLARPKTRVLERRQLIDTRDEQQRRATREFVTSIIGETIKSDARTR